MERPDRSLLWQDLVTVPALSVCSSGAVLPGERLTACPDFWAAGEPHGLKPSLGYWLWTAGP